MKKLNDTTCIILLGVLSILATLTTAILALIVLKLVIPKREVEIGQPNPTIVQQTAQTPTITMSPTPFKKDSYISLVDIRDDVGVFTEEPTPIPTQLPSVTEEPLDVMTPETTKRYNFTNEERELLARLIMAEAEGEGLVGKALVGCVVMNRVKSREWANTIRGVIYQSGQFAVVKNGRIDRVKPDSECYKAIDMLEDWWDESKGAMYFRTVTPTRSEWHYSALTFLFDHNGHSFFK